MNESEIIFAVEESPEGGFEAKALGHPIHTQADTIDELKGMVQDAVRCHFDEGARPRVIRLHLVRDEGIARTFEPNAAKLRDELLNGETFDTVLEAQVLVENWRRHYNAVRPHSSLGYRLPAPEAVQPWPSGSAALRL